MHTIAWRAFSFDSGTKAATHEDREEARTGKERKGTKQVEVVKSEEFNEV